MNTPLQSSESNEWYTPAVYVEAARHVLGRIDLDPASNVRANEIVKAENFYTIEDDGLTQDWRGRVFMNPPWGRTGPHFVAKLLTSYDMQMVSAAVVICAARTETRWFHPLFEHTICFPDHRIKFWLPSGASTQPTTTPAIIYMGKKVRRFVEEFSQFGPCVRRVRLSA